ncbi:PfkB family carbohydrate kinase [Fredinandcohnia onubensis]|uniref:PfkB family carbohydrate kinase n=1 Tax=Fredinandcohnia onubensis TaxID=1571209 RepID=UPI000C0BC6BB|nr:PfkB family carbohydrate kinase [Fredinandcohnia onubensis]
MYGVTALGELLIDFTPSGQSERGNVLFETNPGGAPANVLVALSKLDVKTSFIGKVGQDHFGIFLKNTLEKMNVDTLNLLFSNEANTTLAFVHLDPSGDRSFSFYRESGADILLREVEISEQQIKNSTIFHFGSLSLTHEPATTATFTALNYAKKHGVLISYDPNLRLQLWDSVDRAKEMIKKGLEYADIVKLSEEELLFLTGTRDVEKGTELIKIRYQCPLILVTLGPSGSFFRSTTSFGRVGGFKVDVVDTTGAGDAFVGGTLYKILEKNKKLYELTKDDYMEVLNFANATGALATTSKGGIPSMPTLEQIEKLVSNQ